MTNKESWLVNRDGRAFCEVCSKMLTNNNFHINRHETSAEHMKIEANLQKQPLLDQGRQEAFQKQTKKVKIAELRIIMFLLVNKLPFSLTGPLIALIQSVASDSVIASDLKCERTKCTNETNTILNEEGEDGNCRSSSMKPQTLRQTNSSLFSSDIMT